MGRLNIYRPQHGTPVDFFSAMAMDPENLQFVQKKRRIWGWLDKISSRRTRQHLNFWSAALLPGIPVILSDGFQVPFEAWMFFKVVGRELRTPKVFRDSSEKIG